MKVLRTATTTAVSAALLLGAPLAAFADDGEASAPEAPAPEAPAAEAPAAAESSSSSDAPAPAETPAAPAADTAVAQAPAPADPVVAPAPEAPAGEAAPEGLEPAAEPAPEGAEPAAAAPAADPAVEDAAPAEDAAPTDGAAPTDDAEPADETTTADTTTTLRAAVAAGLLGATQAAYPDAEYQPHWHDGYYQGFPCDYWYFNEPAEGGSGKDWSGWYGQPQLHILHHTLEDDDGTLHMVYDRDIAGYWYHAWSGDESVTPDPEGIHWENTSAQQTILVNGYKGGNDAAARAAEARALLDSAGVTTVGTPWEEYLGWYQSSIDQGWYTVDDVRGMYDEQQQRSLDYTAYEATQFAVWYFSTGHDVMGLFFDVDASNHVTVSDFAQEQFASSGNGYSSDRGATLQTAAWLIEQALTTNVVMPQPGFVSNGFVRNTDGSTDYGFTASLAGGSGNVHVELRTADGSPMPAGVVLVDAQGRVVDSVTPGQKVFVRVPAGTSVADLPQFQLWGSAQGTQQGSPHFYTGWDHNNHGEGSVDPETGQWTPSTFQHWFIGLGELDRPSTAWDWIGVTLADEPEAPVDPVDPVDPTDPTDPTDPVQPVDPVDPTDPTDPVQPVDPTDGVYADPTGTVVEVADTTDPTNLGLTDAQPVADVEQAAQRDALATTGTDASVLAAGAFIVLAGTGLVLASRRRRSPDAR
jgi:outer membrane biosynthesis protein TonB